MDEKFFRYSALDSACMMEIYEKFWPTVGQGYQATYDMTMSLMPVLAFMQTKGIAVDHTKLEETRKEVLQRAAEKEAELHQLCGFPLNVNSGKQVAEYFYITLGLPPILKPKTKALTTDDLAMQRLVRGTAKNPGRPEAKLVQEIRGLKKLYSTYLSIEFDADNRMRGAYNPRGCLLPETEVLTKLGWVSLENFQEGTYAMQWDPSGKLSWGLPKKVKYNVSELLWKCSSEHHECSYTSDHRIPSYMPARDKFEVRTAKHTAETYRQIPVSGQFEGTRDLTGIIRVLAMVQADGSVSDNNIILTFKKARKIQRCRELLEACNLGYTMPKANEGCTRFCISVEDSEAIIELLGREKLWGSWLLGMNAESMEEFLDELQYWDASPKGDTYRYNTKHKKNAEWVATIAHLRNRRAFITHRLTGYCPIYRVNVTRKTRVSVKPWNWDTYEYTGKVYCLVTDTQYFLARHNGKIFITGNTMYGRLSSSKTIFGTGMNMQNLPPDFKKFLVADPGYVLIEFDKRQAEWVVVAYASDDSNMIRAIEQGLDVHAYTASLMFHVPMEVVAHENGVIGHISNPDQIKELRQTDDVLRQHDHSGWPRSMTLRQCGKKSNHGLNYDEGPNTFALTNEIEIGEAKRIIAMYHEGYPSIRKWYDHVQRQLKASRTLENCFGRRVKFMGEWGTDLWKSSYSMIPQSTVVDSLNSGMVKVYNDPLLAREYNIDILAQVHDSILVQVPIEVMQDETKYDELMRRVNDYTSPTLSYNGNDFRIATDAKVGFNWGGKHKVHNTEGMRDCKSYDDVRALLQLRGVAHGTGSKQLA